jgi:hypothetical protein
VGSVNPSRGPLREAKFAFQKANPARKRAVLVCISASWRGLRRLARFVHDISVLSPAAVTHRCEAPALQTAEYVTHETKKQEAVGIRCGRGSGWDVP